MAITRIQRWVIILFSYQYIQYISTEKHSNADVFSRCPLGEAEGTDVRADVLYVDGGKHQFLLSVRTKIYWTVLELHED